jgi:ribosomal protein L14E/L6E/L27E
VKELENNDLIGRVVYSKAGRDKDANFVIVGILNESFVYIADGKLRKIEKPKKKKLRHLIFTETLSEEIRILLLTGKKVNNSKIRKFLEARCANKEV